MTTQPYPLTPEQLAEIRDELLRDHARLERSLNLDGGGRPREIDQSAVGRLSRIEALQNQGMTQDLEDRKRVRFERVVEALGRLDAGTFGICVTCRSPIRFERLRVYPETLNCATCGGS